MPLWAQTTGGDPIQPYVRFMSACQRGKERQLHVGLYLTLTSGEVTGNRLSVTSGRISASVCAFLFQSCSETSQRDNDGHIWWFWI